MKRLIIAEKYSVAKNIAEAVGAKDYSNVRRSAKSAPCGWIEGNDDIVSWFQGHVYEFDTSGIDRKWTIEGLPVEPDWSYRPLSYAKSQVDVLRRLANRGDVSIIVNAADADREGELIFREFYYSENIKKPFARLWADSQTESALRAELGNLKDSSEFDGVYESALSRSRADWFVGINATRLYTLLESGGSVVSVGRVQTPTLAMIVERDRQIENFISKSSWVIKKNFDGWSMESDRYSSEEDAKRIASVLEGRPVRITSLKKEMRKQSPPPLYALNDILQDCNKRLGLTAKEAQQILQGLYEKKLITYPRTDFRYLTADKERSFFALANALSNTLLNRDIKGVKAVIGKKSESHSHDALVPTDQYIKNRDRELSRFTGYEASVMRLIEARCLIAIADWHEWEETKIAGTALYEEGGKSEEIEFLGNGRIEKKSGWREIERRLLGSQKGDDTLIPDNVLEGTFVVEISQELIRRDTKPPVRFTDATLLDAMEKAGKGEFPEGAERVGLGTSATRAQIIDRLIAVGHIRRAGKALISTDKGRALIDEVEDQMKSPDLTVGWEWRLKDVEKGIITVDDFMDDIRKSFDETLRRERSSSEKRKEPSVVGSCPICRSPVISSPKGYQCTSCNVFLRRSFSGHTWTSSEVDSLFKGDALRVSLVSKNGHPYNALISLKPEKDPVFGTYSFSFEFDNSAPVRRNYRRYSDKKRKTSCKRSKT